MDSEDDYEEGYYSGGTDLYSDYGDGWDKDYHVYDEVILTRQQMELEHQQITYSERFLPLYSKNPWFVAQRLEGDQIFYNLHNSLSLYKYQIPELVGNRIEGCFHGWVVLSNRDIWSIWNPLTSKIISLPPLRSYISIGQCCLSSAPDTPNSLLLLTRNQKYTFLFCRLTNSKKLGWMELSYAKELENITESTYDCLHSLTCCNGKIYAISKRVLIHVDVVVQKITYAINLLPLVKLPSIPFIGYRNLNHDCSTSFLKGSGKNLFFILRPSISRALYLFRFNMTSIMWEEIDDLKDALFFVDASDNQCDNYNHRHHTLFYNSKVASGFGGYVHIRDNMGKVLYSYHIKDKTVSISSLPSLVRTRSMSLWECRLSEKDKDDHVLVVDKVDIDSTSMRNELHEENGESHLLKIPFDVLGHIMKFCVGVEYFKFRATCKSCRLAAPLSRVKKLLLNSPWLVVLDAHRGIITFTDPMFGENYYIKTPQELVGDLRIRCSKYGWLLIEKYEETQTQIKNTLVFLNPFTRDIRELPQVALLATFCFSTPPTSSSCMVVGLGVFPYEEEFWQIHIHYVAREPSWRVISLNNLDVDPYHEYGLYFPTLDGQDLYVLSDNGRLFVTKAIESRGETCRSELIAAPISFPEYRGQRRIPCDPSKYFLIRSDPKKFLVMVGEFGEWVKVFELNYSKGIWEEVYGLGRFVIYISDATCLCTEAKTREMENNIYFPRLHSMNGNIVFYSLETRMYHTSSNKNMEESFKDLFGTKLNQNPHAWIEPSWS